LSDRRAEQGARGRAARVDEGFRIGTSLLARADVEPLLRAFILLVAIAAVLAGIAAVFGNDLNAGMAAVAALVVALLLHLLTRAGLFGLGAALWTWTLLAIAVFVTVTGKGSRDVGMNVFPVVIISAGLLLERRLALATMLVTVVAGGMIGVAELAGWLTNKYSADTRADQVAQTFVLLSAITALVVLLSGALHRSLQKTFATERSYAQIFNATHDAILVADPETRAIVNANESARRVFGRPGDTLIGTKLEQLLGDVDEDGRSIVEHIRAGLASDGRRFEVGLRLAGGTGPELEIALQKAIVGGKVHILTVVRDIGERRAIERTLREGEKLRVVGQLARGVAHDFNNQLTGILGSATLLETFVGETPAARGHLDVIERSARRSTDLVSQLLAFARAGKQRSDAVDCNRLVDEVEQLLRRSLDKRIDIRVRKATSQVMTFGDATQLQNALLNLALNARDAMPTGGELTLSLRPIAVDDQSRRGLPGDLPNGRYASLVVADTGTGIDEGTLPHIFEPFFTTKERGNGMGLAAVYGTMRSHGGATRVESRPGHGTRFELLLPLADASAPIEEAPPPDGGERRGPMLAGLRVLVGDDEPFVRETTALLLQRQGCLVETAPTGDAVLRIFAAASPRPDLVLLDHDMPGLSGTETAVRLHELDAEVPILIMSGYGHEVATDGGVIRGLLPKPFSEEQLAQAVLSAIDGGRRRTVH
jgi:PAS domain S-box-containing protein